MKILVTGATNGMGKGTALVLAEADQNAHELILLGRSEEKCRATTEEITRKTGNTRISHVLCDLTDLAAVKKCSAILRSRHEYLDGLYINAGLGYASGPNPTKDGMDPHFQVNYLSQFMLTLNLLGLLEKSDAGGRVVFNVTKGGLIDWDDLQMKNKWHYEKGIRQAMAAKRILYSTLHSIYARRTAGKVSFFGFQIPKTVYSNQINIIPSGMRRLANLIKIFGGFISIEENGKITAPLFTESGDKSLMKSGKFISWKKGRFIELKDTDMVKNPDVQEKLWSLSLDLCGDKETEAIAEKLKP